MRNKHTWVLLAMLLVGIVLGSFLGNLASGIAVLSWLNFGQSFGLNTPLELDLGVIVITFGISIRITMASIFGIIAALLIYHCL
ncbi:MAG: DUF4321 domain-containing protein [Clostridiales bacterium]|nr:DUF4321 domain-containing protein [Clostridiales bacterium]